MKLAYRVHSVAQEQAVVRAVVDGEEGDVTVYIMVAEIVSEDGRNSHTLRLRGSAEERADLVRNMVPGAPVELHIVFPEA